MGMGWAHLLRSISGTVSLCETPHSRDIYSLSRPTLPPGNNKQATCEKGSEHISEAAPPFAGRDTSAARGGRGDGRRRRAVDRAAGDSDPCARGQRALLAARQQRRRRRGDCGEPAGRPGLPGEHWLKDPHIKHRIISGRSSRASCSARTGSCSSNISGLQTLNGLPASLLSNSLSNRRVAASALSVLRVQTRD